MKKLVIFDMDGTITDTSYDIYDNVNKTMSQFGYPPITREETKAFVGDGAKKLIERALKNAACDNFQEVLDFYNNSYNFCGSPKTKVYDGVKELMTFLKKSGYKLAIVSNKPQDGTVEVYKKFFSDISVDYVFGQREGIKVKPDPACVFFVLKELSVDKADAVFVGDSDVDAKTFINAGMDGICVLWGYRKKETLEKLGVKEFAENCDELKRKILAL